MSNGGTTYYIGNYFEVYVPNGESATFNKYYYFGSQRIAARIANTLFYLQGDHLGSSSVVMTQAGTSFYSRQTYYPYGAQRTTEGSALPTDYTFTGQKNDDSTGLMFYGARYYDAALGRFTQPDTIVPSPLNPQSLNRFAYVLNNPVRYVDPSGHMEVDPTEGTGGGNGDPNDTDLEKTIEVIMPNPNGGDPMGVTLYVPFCDRHPEANRCGDNQTGAKTGKNQGPEKLPVAQGKKPSQKYAYERFLEEASRPQFWYRLGEAADFLDAEISIGAATITTLSILGGPDTFAVVYGGAVIVNTADIPLSITGTVATFIGDEIAGETNVFVLPGSPGFKIGANTINSVASTLASAIVPDPFADAVINAYQYAENDKHLLEQVVPFLRPFPSSLFGK